MEFSLYNMVISGKNSKNSMDVFGHCIHSWPLYKGLFQNEITYQEF